jgi:DNA-binding transcriptional LysR family regulator
MNAKVSLEQWQAFVMVVEAGGYSLAAERLRKSQSSVSYAVQKLEAALGVSVFEIEGRRAVLTERGQVFYRRAKQLLEEASLLEKMAEQLSEGWEPKITLAMDTIFPEWLMLEVLQEFTDISPLTRIELQETVLSGTDEVLLKKQADIVIGGRVPPGFIADPLMEVTFKAVASPTHPLHELGRTLTLQDLKQHRQLVVKDSGSRNLDAGWLGSQQRLTLSHINTSIKCAVRGLGFAWYPVAKIAPELESGLLKPLLLELGAERKAQLYLIYSNSENTGKMVRQLGELIQTKVSRYQLN